ncbi:hypothetical protein [uncultured Nonlabens sp.]|uniref:hypothetical protein n=1 Tax=uncultured Nonlabens sp. TaxID=859306 RepID=UPI0026344783|nr:hypothetical protein [uncultured Nonlabens sp.]
MIHFNYIHVPTNKSLEKFTSEKLQVLHEESKIRRIDITYKKIFDIKNRTREVALIKVSLEDKNMFCEIESLNFKKSVGIAVNTLMNELLEKHNLMSA